MRGRLSLNGLVVGVAALAALLLTVTRPSPSGLIQFGMGEQEVRAEPGAPASSVRKKHNLTALRVFNRTLVRIRDSYVDPLRINPKKMLYAALDSVQFNIPEVLVEPNEAKDEVTVVVSDKQKTFSTKEVDAPWRLSSKLKKIFLFIEANMNPGADLAQVEYAAVNGMLSTLDPHSVLLDPEFAREMDVSTSGKFGGLGIVIGMRKRKLTVLRPMKGTPAHEAGIKAKDHIAKINDEVTENLTLNEAVDRMRGDPGTRVTIWVQRKDEPKLIRFDIVRDTIKVPSVEYKLLSKNVGYIKLKQFAGRTAKEVKAAMADLRGQGASRWVLDLRRNPGGLLEQAIQVSDLFLEKGTIVTTVGGHEREPRRANRKNTDSKSPVAVLVNGNSASASEIVAGALKNLNRSITIGSTSFGKGSVQILYDNSDGSKLKLTIAQYLTPNNVSIQSVGIVPDIELARLYVPKKNDATTDFVRIQPPAERYGEKDLKAHLDSKFAKQATKPEDTLTYLYQSKSPVTGRDGQEEEPETDDLVIDYEIELARDIVAASPSANRQQLIRQAKKLITRRRAKETAKIAKALQVLKIDWAGTAASQKVASLDAKFEVKDHAKEIKAGEKIELVGTVTNTGTVPAHRVKARVKSGDRVFNGTELVFGRIDPGQTRTWTARLQIPQDSLDRIAALGFELTAQGKIRAKTPGQKKYRIIAANRPVFAYTHQLIDASNGDGLVQTKERHRLRVTVKNTGTGTAKETTAILRNASGSDVLMKKARFELGELKPGASETVEFEFHVGPSVKQNEVVVELSVYDSVLRESVAEKLKYPVRKSSSGPASASGSVKVSAKAATIYEGASRNSVGIATAPKGTVFKLTGRQADWYRVEMSSGQPGFVLARQVKKTRSRPRLGSVKQTWQVTPPTLSVAIPSYEVKGSTYKLRGIAQDDLRVEDVYIFVSNRKSKVGSRKVFYKSNRGGKKGNELKFAADIPISPGENMVTIVARETNQVRSSHTLYLYRNDSGTVAEVSKGR